jgi:hypothetical protein
MKCLIEYTHLGRIANQNRAQRRAEVIRAQNTGGCNCSNGIQHHAGPDRQTGLTQRSAEQQYVLGQTAFARFSHGLLRRRL